MKVSFKVDKGSINQLQYDIIEVIRKYIEAHEDLKEVKNFIQKPIQYGCSIDRIEDGTYYINILDYDELVFWYLVTSLMNFKKK